MSVRPFSIALTCCVMSACANQASVDPGTGEASRDSSLPITVSGKSAEVRLLMQRVHVREAMLRGVQKSFTVLRTQLHAKHPDWSPKMLDLVQEASLDVFTDKIENGNEAIDLFAQIYSRHYTAAEIHELLVFYSSSTGQKVVSTTPVIESEALTMGQSYGETLAVDIAKRIVERCGQSPGVCPKNISGATDGNI